MQTPQIKREVVQVLSSRLASIGAQKGAIFSTSSFQAGAIRYAKKHGIALIQIVNGAAMYEVRGLGCDSKPPKGIPYLGWYQMSMTGENSIGSRSIQPGESWLFDFVQN